MFNFKEALQQSKNLEESQKDALFVCILGASGEGKSHNIGTLGKKTLYLSFSTEFHGAEVARKEGGELISSLILDVDSEGQPLSPDFTLSKLRSILDSDLVGEGFEAVAIDSLTALDECITSSNELKKMCMTSSGKVDMFKTIPMAKKIMRGITSKLISLQKTQGIHVITTCALDVTEVSDEGRIIRCAPKLNSFGLAEDVLLSYPDRVVIASVINSKGKEVKVYDFGVESQKVSKTATGVIKKMFSIKPRLLSGEIPEKGVCKADLKELLTIRGLK